jgi:hypothetical protein
MIKYNLYTYIFIGLCPLTTKNYRLNRLARDAAEYLIVCYMVAQHNIQVVYITEKYSNY